MAPQDLRTLLTSARDDAPPPRLSVDDITAAGRHLEHRRRQLALLSSAGGGVVAAIAAVAAVLMLNNPEPMTPALDPSRLPALPSPAAPAEFVAASAFTTTYQGYTAGRYVVSDPDLVTTAYQQSTIAPVSSTPAPFTPPPLTSTPEVKTRASGIRAPGGVLVVYREHTFEPTVFDPSERIQLRGSVGLLHYAIGQKTPPASPEVLKRYGQFGGVIPALAWQYSDDAWAAIYWSSWEDAPTVEELAAIADGLTPAQPKEFRIGFRLKTLPQRYFLVAASLGQDAPDGSTLISSVRLTLKPPQAPLTGMIDFETLGAITLSVGVNEPGDPSAPTGSAVKPACTTGALVCTRPVSDRMYVRVEGDGTKLFPPGLTAELTTLMDPANPDDPGNWPPVTEVFTE
ncbi:hypothetical protein GCM10010399_48630 [Dactylosporangium fulvum]|uniref:Uncharacterized protein n=1 Tax=Dactylosporangium fulvum TaxID=53359 RepID=A0ABY5VUT0_9ACTN|nr:hypothetical protein [Dactylosporangium fulvum]UWP80596.1 hypothetical protein Dfulv_36325 [Dactylosporangium fulvum]